MQRIQKVLCAITAALLISPITANAEPSFEKLHEELESIGLDGFNSDTLKQTSPLMAVVFMRMPERGDGRYLCELRDLETEHEVFSTKFVFVMDKQFTPPTEATAGEFECLEEVDGQIDYEGQLVKRLGITHLPRVLLSNGKKTKKYPLNHAVSVINRLLNR